MSYAAVILTDSVAPSGVRLTTALVTIPRIVLAEITRHRMFSFSVASSRAIPTARLLEQVREHPFIPAVFAANQRGMQAAEALSDYQQVQGRAIWEEARNAACLAAEGLTDPQLSIHKQWANRLLEPFLWTTVLMTGVAAAWCNFFWLRCHPDAQPELRHAAELLRDAYFASVPEAVPEGEWHLPFITADERVACLPEGRRGLRLISVARCARVSYERHGLPWDWEADRKLAARLEAAGHWSCFEHQAMAVADASYHSGNLCGWLQFRKLYPQEMITDLEKVRPKTDADPREP